MTTQNPPRVSDMDFESDPAMTPGQLVGGNADNYPIRSYQRLIQDRTRTVLSVIYDMVRSADFDEKKRDAVDGGLMLGAWALSAPGMNRKGRIRELDIELEVATEDMEDDRIEELLDAALEDARAGVSQYDGDDIGEQEVYALARARWLIKLEIAHERAAGKHYPDYTAVHDKIADGEQVQSLIHELPIYFHKVLIMANVSIAHDNIEREHIEALVANEGPSRRRSRSGPAPGEKMRERFRRRRPKADDSEDW